MLVITSNYLWLTVTWTFGLSDKQNSIRIRLNSIYALSRVELDFTRLCPCSKRDSTLGCQAVWNAPNQVSSSRWPQGFQPPVGAWPCSSKWVGEASYHWSLFYYENQRFFKRFLPCCIGLKISSVLTWII